MSSTSRMDFPLTLQESVTAVEFLMLSSCCALFSNIFCSAASHVFWTASTQGIPSEAARLFAKSGTRRGCLRLGIGTTQSIPSRATFSFRYLLDASMSSPEKDPMVYFPSLTFCPAAE